MKKIKFLMIFGVSIILIFSTNKTFAESKEISILEYSQQEYAIYIKELLEKNFKYAFSEKPDIQENDLNYIVSKKDSEENNLIFLEKQEYQNYNGRDIYLWVKDGDNTIIKGEKLNFANTVSRNEIVNLENITKLIDVQLDKNIELKTVENGIEKSKNLGTIQFNNKNNKYYYKLLKIEDNQNYQNLFNLIDKVNKEYSNLDIVEKINILKELKNLENEIIENVELQDVKNFQIIEPEDTKEGQKYIAIIQELGETEVFDIQLLTSTRKYEEKYVTEEIKDNEIQNNVVNDRNNEIEAKVQPTTLPITYDSKILIIIMAIIITSIVFTWVKYKNLEKKKENEN